MTPSLPGQMMHQSKSLGKKILGNPCLRSGHGGDSLRWKPGFSGAQLMNVDTKVPISCGFKMQAHPSAVLVSGLEPWSGIFRRSLRIATTGWNYPGLNYRF